MSTIEVRRVEHFPTTYGAYRCVVVWHGVEVEVDHMDQPCDPAHCLLDVLTNDVGATGDLFCAWCYGVADAPVEQVSKHANDSLSCPENGVVAPLFLPSPPPVTSTDRLAPICPAVEHLHKAGRAIK